MLKSDKEPEAVGNLLGNIRRDKGGALGFQIGFALDAMRSALCALRFREKEG
jgi:hypothetical protein